MLYVTLLNIYMLEINIFFISIHFTFISLIFSLSLSLLSVLLFKTIRLVATSYKQKIPPSIEWHFKGRRIYNLNPGVTVILNNSHSDVLNIARIL